MRTKRTKLLVVLALAAIFVLAMSCLFITACDDKVETCAIEWKLPDGVTAKVEGYDKLPEEWEKDTDLAFTLTIPNGYNAAVRAYSSLSLKDGKYSFTVNKEATITVTLTKILNGITVTDFDENKQYYDDETVPTTDFKVVANYALGDETVTSGITITYKNGKALATGDTTFTVNYGGQSYEVTLAKKVISPYNFDTAELVLEEDKPVIVVKGSYNANIDAETAKAGIEGYLHDATERGGSWATKEFTAVATVNEDKSFELKLKIDGMTPGNQYFFHIKDGADASNFTCTTIINESVVIGNSNDNIYTGTTLDDTKCVTDSKGGQYYIGFCKSWTPNTLFIHYEWKNAPKVTVSTVGFEARDEKAYLVYTGTCENLTEETLPEFYFDHEVTSVAMLEGTVKSFETVDGKTNFVIEFEITDFTTGTHWLHYSAKGNNLGGTTVAEGKETITVDGKTYTFSEAYSCRQVIVA